MGVYGFFSRFTKRLEGVVTKQLPRNVEGVVIDFNGVIHGAAQAVFLYGDDVKKEYKTPEAFFEYKKQIWESKTEEIIMKEFIDYIPTVTDYIISSLSPKQYVFIAVDGVAPNAKIAQQRSRRYKSVAENIESAKTAVTVSVGEDGIYNDSAPLFGFDPNQISPGTKLMRKINTKLTEYYRHRVEASIKERQQAYSVRKSGGTVDRSKATLPKVFVYSPHTEPGEGEHKAFAMVRKYLRDGNIVQGNGSHIIFGADADLTMLALGSPLRNVYATRANLNGQVTENINIDRFFTAVRLKMTAGDTAVSSGFKEETLRRDFIVLSLLMGNDFIPKPPGISAVDDVVFEAYASINAPLTCDGIGEVGTDPYDKPTPEILVASLGNLFSALADVEPSLLESRYSDEVLDARKGKPRYENTTLIHEAMKETVTGDSRTKALDYGEFATSWYTESTHLREKTSGTTLLPEDASEDVSDAVIGKVRDMMVCEYLSGIAWIFRYYTGGQDFVNWSYKYAFVLSPLFADIEEALITAYPQALEHSKTTEGVSFQPILSHNAVLDIISSPASPEEEDIEAEAAVEHIVSSLPTTCGLGGITETTGPIASRGTSAIAPIHQLMAILPSESLARTVNRELANSLVTGNLSHVGDTDFETYYKGNRKKYEGIPLVAEIDFDEIKEAIIETDEASKARRVAASQGKREKENAAILEDGGRIKKYWAPPQSLIPLDLKQSKGDGKIIYSHARPVRTRAEVLVKAGRDPRLADTDTLLKRVTFAEYESRASVAAKTKYSIEDSSMDAVVDGPEEEEVVASSDDDAVVSPVVDVVSSRRRRRSESPPPVEEAPIAPEDVPVTRRSRRTRTVIEEDDEDVPHPVEEAPASPEEVPVVRRSRRTRTAAVDDKPTSEVEDGAQVLPPPKVGDLSESTSSWISRRLDDDLERFKSLPFPASEEEVHLAVKRRRRPVEEEEVPVPVVTKRLRRSESVAPPVEEEEEVPVPVVAKRRRRSESVVPPPPPAPEAVPIVRRSRRAAPDEPVKEVKRLGRSEVRREEEPDEPPIRRRRRSTPPPTDAARPASPLAPEVLKTPDYVYGDEVPENVRSGNPLKPLINTATGNSVKDTHENRRRIGIPVISRSPSRGRSPASPSRYRKVTCPPAVPPPDENGGCESRAASPPPPPQRVTVVSDGAEATIPTNYFNDDASKVYNPATKKWIKNTSANRKRIEDSMSSSNDGGECNR